MTRPVDHPSPNHGTRRAAIDMLVLHYTGMANAADALARLCDPAAEVSAHYLVEEDGTVHALVPEERRAWHAGLSMWQGAGDVNSRSVGIELVNPGHEFGYRPFPEIQLVALIDLASGVLARHSIPPWNVVGHSDVAPVRKHDPGELFPWHLLKGHGIGLWPFTGDEQADPADTVEMLARYGYDTGIPEAAIAAFQRHFRPQRVDGIADAETAGRARRLLDAVGGCAARQASPSWSP
ncbi:N-acetylmuramoyl-L-alanine amidase [Magnetospirillum sp. UT-4]|uniref:N-acetylmuramoyl-L-alanine amidase n=1 Tax=Magnetospirillum sp. UT-4 TaxID=2681467 RepID=UPI001380BC34|nr:N-acetylmuramoyl-L-alanine amidase [Magnetospirillum sp. UT-4]CAA7623239.1 N-acetylmuramoyl-L-alanine amidase AmiD [Magnetospirillum sp. UT-4]